MRAFTSAAVSSLIPPGDSNLLVTALKTGSFFTYCGFGSLGPAFASLGLTGSGGSPPVLLAFGVVGSSGVGVSIFLASGVGKSGVPDGLLPTPPFRGCLGLGVGGFGGFGNLGLVPPKPFKIVR